MHSIARRLLTPLALAMLLSGCGTSAGTSPGPTNPPGGGPSPGCTAAKIAAAGPVAIELLTACASAMSPGELRLFLMDQLGERWYCDPDEYPVAHGTEQERAIERYPEMVAEDDLFSAVAFRLGIRDRENATDAEKLQIYHLWKIGLSIPLDPVGNGRYRFDYLSQPANGAAEGTRTAGTIDTAGTITIEQKAAAGEPICPICLARGTRIDTPTGQIAIDDLRLGDAIWTVDAAGRRVAGTVIALGSTTAPANHRVIHLVLADGRSVTASPGHRLADGRTLGSLAVGDDVNGSLVVEARSLAYGGGETFDLVVSGETGFYLSDGIPLDTTLTPAAG